MAKGKENAKGRGSVRRESTKKNNGYWLRQQKRTNRNIEKRIDRHILRNPSDKVAKVAKKKMVERLGLGKIRG